MAKYWTALALLAFGAVPGLADTSLGTIVPALECVAPQNDDVDPAQGYCNARCCAQYRCNQEQYAECYAPCHDRYYCSAACGDARAGECINDCNEMHRYETKALCAPEPTVTSGL